MKSPSLLRCTGNHALHQCWTSPRARVDRERSLPEALSWNSSVFFWKRNALRQCRASHGALAGRYLVDVFDVDEHPWLATVSYVITMRYVNNRQCVWQPQADSGAYPSPLVHAAPAPGSMTCVSAGHRIENVQLSKHLLWVLYRDLRLQAWKHHTPCQFRTSDITERARTDTWKDGTWLSK
eukprot:910595-Rhodomonas_salina.5